MKMKYVLCLLAIFLGLGATASVYGANDAAAISAQGLADFHRTYKGKIGGKYAITMDLTKSGNELKGSYKYAGKHGTLTLQGTVDDAGAFKLAEYNDAGAQTGSFSGTLSGDSIAGEWSSPDGGKTLSFEGYKTAEFRAKAR
jgi:hypothetical protein